jgi:hypothetical protein
MSHHQALYERGLGRNSWCDRLARRVKPENIDGNMGVRAKLWRALVDWGWGVELDAPRSRRLLWAYRRLAPAWMPQFYSSRQR